MRNTFVILLALTMLLTPVQGSDGDTPQIDEVTENSVFIEEPAPVRKVDAPILAPRAEDWPMFMHDIERNSNTTSRIPTSNESLWNFSTGQTIQSSAAIVDGVVFFGSNDNNFYAVWANNGTEKWRFNDNNNLEDIPSSPSVINDKVYFYAMNAGMYCLWASNGTKIWNTTIATPNHRNFNSPLVVNDSVYISDDLNPATIYSLNATTGEINWDQGYSGYIVSSMSYKNGKVFVGRQSGGVLCLWANNGTEFWYGRPAGGAVYSTPSISEDKVFYTTELGVLYALHLSNGTEAWNYDTGPQTYSSPALSGDKVFIAGSAYYQSNGTQVWSNGFSEYSTPAVSGNRLVVLNDTKLVSQDTEDGSIIWEAEVTGEYASPAVAENMVVIGGNDREMHAFSTPDVTPPNVTDNYPADLATEVALDESISVTFSELMEESRTEDAFTIDPSITGQFIWDSEEMTFDPDAPLMGETVYTVTVSGDATDRSGNPLDGDYDGTSEGSPVDDFTFSFTTVMSSPPNITDTYPADQDIDVPPNIQIVVNFSQSMNEGVTESAFSISPSAAGSFSWSLGSTSMTFEPSENLQDQIQYNCTIGFAAEGQSGKLFDGNGDGTAAGDATDDFTWSFTVKDWGQPSVISVTPEDGELDVPVNTTIEVEFSEEMNVTSTEAAFGIDPVIGGEFAWDGVNMTFTPDADLAYETEYTIAIEATATDLTGNDLDGDGDGGPWEPDDDHIWTFTTASEVIPDPAPVVVEVSPVDGATDVPVYTDIVIRFSQPMNTSVTEGSIMLDDLAFDMFVASWDMECRNLTLNLTVNLTETMTHTVKVTGDALSAAGIGLDGDSDTVAEGRPTDDHSWSFTTGEKPVQPEPPTIVSVSPEADATDVPIHGNIVVNFSEPMDRTSTEAAYSLDPHINFGASWNDDNKSMVIAFWAPFLFNTTYTVKVSGAAMSALGVGLDGDEDGLAEGAGIDDHTWQFTTMELVVEPKPPVVTIIYPSEGAKMKRMVQIRGTAEDVDTPLADVDVEIMVDDGSWIPVGSGGDWGYLWDTTKVSNGEHTIKVRAYDGELYSEEVTRTVTVDNPEEGKPGLGGLDSTLLIAIIVIIIVVIVISLIVVMKMRGRKGEGGGPVGPQQPDLVQGQPQPQVWQQPQPGHPGPGMPPTMAQVQAPVTPPAETQAPATPPTAGQVQETPAPGQGQDGIH
jgi:outer membrane protein assembly factor BamB